MQKLLHPVTDACGMLGLGRTKFYAEVNAGRITLVHAGKKALVPQSSIDTYVERLIAESAASRAA